MYVDVHINGFDDKIQDQKKIWEVGAKFGILGRDLEFCGG